MVKGVSKRVIVVKAPVHGIFEQAIFFIGDGAFSGTEVDAENILKEACAVADNYVRTHCRTGRKVSKGAVISSLLSCSITLILAVLFYLFAF